MLRYFLVWVCMLGGGFGLPQVCGQLQVATITAEQAAWEIPSVTALYVAPTAYRMMRPVRSSDLDLRYRPELAFFCRVEVKLEQAVGLPVRFRLGSVDYVDRLEGKRQ